MHWPEAETPIDEELVRMLLREQHPDLCGLPLQLADAGWDNVMWRLGPDLAIRMPRRSVAASLIEHEQRWLPELAPGLPLPVPVPLRKGRPGGGYPWCWSVVPWLEGRPGDRSPVTDGASTGERLGVFLRALHRVAPAKAPHNPYRSVPLSSRRDTFEERLGKLGERIDASGTRRVWEAGLESTGAAGPRIWLHGDLHPANTLVRNGAVAAVIDFGDVCGGDPAVDIGAAWMSVPDSAIDRFWASYGRRDEDLERRSRAWAVLFSLMLLEIGLESRPTYADVGRACLERLVVG